MTRFIVYLIGVLFLFLGSTCYLKQVEVVKDKIHSADFVEPTQAKVREKMESKSGIFSKNYHLRAEFSKNTQNVLISIDVDKDLYQSVSIGEIHSFYPDGFHWKSKDMLKEKMRSEAYWEKWWGVGGYFVFTMGILSISVGMTMRKK
ncbi:MAG: hypothetical protein JJT78_04865 [Leptospira sp.]|nr:hypothetical protein [Leptospira sp.]